MRLELVADARVVDPVQERFDGRIRAGHREEVAVSPTVLTTDLDHLQSAVEAALGIALLPAVLCAVAVRAGRPERVLGCWCPPSATLPLVDRSARRLSTPVRSFIEPVRERMRLPAGEGR